MRLRRKIRRGQIETEVRSQLDKRDKHLYVEIHVPVMRLDRVLNARQPRKRNLRIEAFYISC